MKPKGMKMRIKAVLRDTEILRMEAGSNERIVAAAKKNLDRVVNLPSLLKVMGLTFDDRCKMLNALKNSDLKIMLLSDSNQHLILIGKSSDVEPIGYQWQ
ncbi:MAG: hypothetical protein ACFFDM_03140 [Candidatus Thorarchaeota archaeon]